MMLDEWRDRTIWAIRRLPIDGDHITRRSSAASIAGLMGMTNGAALRMLKFGNVMRRLNKTFVKQPGGKIWLKRSKNTPVQLLPDWDDRYYVCTDAEWAASEPTE